MGDWINNSISVEKDVDIITASTYMLRQFALLNLDLIHDGLLSDELCLDEVKEIIETLINNLGMKSIKEAYDIIHKIYSASYERLGLTCVDEHNEAFKEHEVLNSLPYKKFPFIWFNKFTKFTSVSANFQMSSV